MAAAAGVDQSGAYQVSAFGEMVALLWNDGRADAAIELEGLWSELARHHQLALMCPYERYSVLELDHADALIQVCALHTSAVWPA